MIGKPLSAPDAPMPAGGYAQAVELAGASRLVFVSGQIPVKADGSVPATFAEQCRTAWANVEAQLRAAGMTFDNLVKVTIFLADRRFALENREVRRSVLGDRTPAMTVVIATIFDEAWLLEIEAIAAA
ncbi:RidA family protein [Marinivivus vitaminiproducens]|uniref:RidA family protein n=1 Tax=Marinivivus vitaminiproducens TaxID=3035935 RepID=UPI0027A62440|nr:RidA family protein [Geminicoccaceae bacterium SCSIO 64248]